MLKKILILSISILSVFSSTANALETKKTFTDVPQTHQYNVAINFLTEQGVTQGYEDGTFGPENPINRAEVLKIILKGSGVNESTAFTQHFPDVNESDWFAPYVTKAKEIGIISGNGSDGTFTPNRQVNLAEFLKMLILTNELDATQFAEEQLFDYLDTNAWYNQYINFAAKAGLLDLEKKVDPSKPLTRAETVNMMYLLSLVTNGNNTQFLLTRAELELSQTEIFLAAKETKLAKNASTLAVDLTQKAFRNIPDNNIVIGAAKLAKAYDFLVDSFSYGSIGELELSAKYANDAIDKATEAWEANNSTETIAKHIKDLAREILVQVGGTEI